MKHEHVVNCPDCGEHMFTVGWDDTSPYVRRIKADVRAVLRRQRRGRLPAPEALAAIEDQLVADVVRKDQSARLDRDQETHHHHCGAAVRVLGDASAPLGRRVVRTRGNGPASVPPDTNNERRNA